MRCATIPSNPVGGAYPYPRVREVFQQRLLSLQKGAEAIVEMWDAPVSSTLRARLGANDVEACMALTQAWMDSPGLDEVLPTMHMPCLLYAGEADGGILPSRRVAHRYLMCPSFPSRTSITLRPFSIRSWYYPM
jgi:hypothetical protein